MAEAERPANTLAATFPPPPPFYKHFTPENIEKINELRAAQEGRDGSQTTSTKLAGGRSTILPTRILDLPSELLFLQPPLPPTNGLYGNFGQIFTLKDELPTLPDGIEQLYETPPDTPSGADNFHDISFILKKLTKSLLLNFLELIGVMSINPALSDAKLLDIRTHFVNMHHILNQYRPHEERESLIMLMEQQVDQAKAEIEGIYAMKKKVEGVLDGLKEMKIPEMEQFPKAKVITEVGKVDDDGYDAWDELSKAFD